MIIDEIPPDCGSELDLVALGPTLGDLDAFVAEERRADAVPALVRLGTYNLPELRTERSAGRAS